MATQQMTEAEMRALARDAAERNGLDPVWFEAQLAQESNYKTGATSRAGARGVAQFMPRTAKAMGVDPSDPVQSIEGAARYMAQLKRRFGGDEATARLAYNWGEGNVAEFQRTGKGLRGRALPQEAAEYNDKIAARIPGGAVPTAVAAAPTAAAPTAAAPTAAAPTSPRVAPAQDDVALIMQEMGQGLPAGSLLQQPLQTPEPLPMLSEQMAAAAAPANPAQPSWLNALQPNTGGPAPVSSEDFVSLLTDQAAQDQDVLLAAAFGGGGAGTPAETRGLPPAVDRYLDRLLSS